MKEYFECWFNCFLTFFQTHSEERMELRACKQARGTGIVKEWFLSVLTFTFIIFYSIKIATVSPLADLISTICPSTSLSIASMIKSMLMSSTYFFESGILAAIL